MASEIDGGKETYSALDRANTAYQGAVQFVNALENNEVTEQSVSDWRSTGRAVAESIVTLYNEGGGQIHDLIFDNAEDVGAPHEMGEKYANALIGEGQSAGLLALMDYSNPQIEHREEIEQRTEELDQFRDENL